MEIISYNIQFGRGLDGRFDLGRICESVKGADIICLQEVEAGWQRSNEIDQAQAISELLPGYYTVYGSSFDVDNSYKTDDGKVVNRRRQHGVQVLSRWPILSSRCFSLPKIHYADKFNMQMGFLEAVIDCDPETFRIYNLHAGYLRAEERRLQFEHFIDVYLHSPQQQGAWSGKPDIDDDDWSNNQETPVMPQSAIVCGDFNCPPGSPEYQYIVESSDLSDCWFVCDRPNLNTSTRRHGKTGDIDISGKIDHIFVSDDLVDRVQEVKIDDAAEGSDHKPVSLKLN
jgi:endonuclease/exonuclease/phosphatase family metal-dependent hydrolase